MASVLLVYEIVTIVTYCGYDQSFSLVRIPTSRAESLRTPAKLCHDLTVIYNGKVSQAVGTNEFILSGEHKHNKGFDQSTT